MPPTIWLRVATSLAFLAGLCLSPSAFASGDEYTGMVWETYGNWYLDGSKTPVRIGEAVPPGALLTANAKDGAESTVILLPDGQRLLCECFEAMRCAQGFRVPPVAIPPSLAVWNMFVGVRNGLLLRPAGAHAPFPPPAGRTSLAAHVETVTSLARPAEVSIASALSVLPAGRYKLTVTDDEPSSASTMSSTQTMSWTPSHGEARVRVPGAGVYRIRVIDLSAALRMEIEVLVTAKDALASETAGLKDAKAAVLNWSIANKGWSLHDFLRAYLQSRVIPGA